MALLAKYNKSEIDTAARHIEEALAPGEFKMAPFFRFPGFASSSALLERLERRGIIVFGADLWASDWDRMSPNQELALVLGRIEANRGGIVLLHDTKARTAAMLPSLLRALKARDYRIVHVAAGDHVK
jgi:peptidoglycan/xylan/chitin deacetylase (PgdA/CDA1 family)